jgi:lysozyme family protein
LKDLNTSFKATEPEFWGLVSTAHSYEVLAPEYQQLWDTMKIIRDASELDRVAKKIRSNQSVYERVEKATGVPWQLVAVIHLREAGEQDIGRWQCVLHNGERIVGTDKLTKLVPAGCGPFSTWHDAAVHALVQKGFHKIKSWPVSRMLWAAEPYNGYGYRNKGLRSPYLWGSTNHQQRGKYIRDGVFDATVMDTQVGVAAQLQYLGVGQKTASPGEVGGPVFGTGLGATLLANGQYIAAGIVFTLVVGFIAYKIIKKK